MPTRIRKLRGLPSGSWLGSLPQEKHDFNSVLAIEPPTKGRYLQ